MRIQYNLPSILQKVVEVGTKSDARLMNNLCVIITVYAVQGSQSTHTSANSSIFHVTPVFCYSCFFEWYFIMYRH